MSTAVTSATNFGEEGDSISDPRYLYRASENAWRAAQNHYAPLTTLPAVYPPVTPSTAVGSTALPTVRSSSIGSVGLPAVSSLPFPKCTARLATSGATSATIAARIVAELAAHPEVDIWICQWGRNDAVLGTNIVAFSTTVFNAIVGAGKRFVYVNCLANGEQQPPANPHDADIATNNAAMQALVATYGASGEYEDWRADVFSAYEPTHNWPPGPNLLTDGLTSPDPIGVHPLQGGDGGRLCSAAIANHWSYQ